MERRRAPSPTPSCSEIPEPAPITFKLPEPYISTDPGEYWAVTDWDDEFKWVDKDLEIRQKNCNKYKDVDRNPPMRQDPAREMPTKIPPFKPGDPEFRLYCLRLGLHEYSAIPDPDYEPPPISRQERDDFTSGERIRGDIIKQRQDWLRQIVPTRPTYRARHTSAMPPNPLKRRRADDPRPLFFEPTPYKPANQFPYWPLNRPLPTEAEMARLWRSPRDIQHVEANKRDQQAVTKIKLRSKPKFRQRNRQTTKRMESIRERSESSRSSSNVSPGALRVNPYPDPTTIQRSARLKRKVDSKPGVSIQTQIQYHPTFEATPGPSASKKDALNMTLKSDLRFQIEEEPEFNYQSASEVAAVSGQSTSEPFDSRVTDIEMDSETSSSEGSIMSWLLHPGSKFNHETAKVGLESQADPEPEPDFDADPEFNYKSASQVGYRSLADLDYEIAPEMSVKRERATSREERHKLEELSNISETSASDGSIMSWLLNPYKDRVSKRAKTGSQVDRSIKAKTESRLEMPPEPETWPGPGPSIEKETERNTQVTSDDSESPESNGSNVSSVLSWLMNPHRDPVEKRPKTKAKAQGRVKPSPRIRTEPSEMQPEPEVEPKSKFTSEKPSEPKIEETAEDFDDSGSNVSSVLSWLMNPHRDPVEKRPKTKDLTEAEPTSVDKTKTEAPSQLEIHPSPGPLMEKQDGCKTDDKGEESDDVGSNVSSVLSWLMNPHRDPVEKRPKTKAHKQSDLNLEPEVQSETVRDSANDIETELACEGEPKLSTCELLRQTASEMKRQIEPPTTEEPVSRIVKAQEDTGSSGSDSSAMSWLMNPHRDPVEKRSKVKTPNRSLSKHEPQAHSASEVEPTPTPELKCQTASELESGVGQSMRESSAPRIEEVYQDLESSDSEGSILPWMSNPGRELKSSPAKVGVVAQGKLERRPETDNEQALRVGYKSIAEMERLSVSVPETNSMSSPEAEGEIEAIIETRPDCEIEYRTLPKTVFAIQRPAEHIVRAPIEYGSRSQELERIESAPEPQALTSKIQPESGPKPPAYPVTSGREISPRRRRQILVESYKQDIANINKRRAVREKREKFHATPKGVVSHIARAIRRRRVDFESIEDAMELKDFVDVAPPSPKPQPKRRGKSPKDDDNPMLYPGENLNDDRLILFHKLNWPGALIRVVIVCVCGFLPIGYQSTVMSGSWHMQDRWLDEWWWTWIDRDHAPNDLYLRKELAMLSYYTVFSLGAVIGAYRARFHIKRHGTKRTLMKSAYYATVAHIGMSITNLIQYISLLYMGRFCIGIYCGINSVAVPIYLLEATRGDMRGPLFAMCSISYAAGIMFSSVLTHHEYLGNQSNLDLMMSITVPFMWVQFVLLWQFCPASPRHLYIMCARTTPATHIFENLTGRRLVVNELMTECAREVNYAMHSYPQLNFARVTAYRQVLKVPGLQRAWRVAVKLQYVWQIATFNCFMGSNSKMLENGRGWESFESAPRLLIIYGVSLFFWSLLNIRLMKTCGRKSLLLSGLIGMAIAQSYQTFVFFYYAHDQQMKDVFYNMGMIFFTMSFAIGPMLIPPLYLVEMFTQDVRYPTVSLAVTAGWCLNAILMTLGYPFCDWCLGRYVLLPGILGTCWSIYFVFMELYESRGMSLIQIHECYRDQKFDQLLLILPVPAARKVILRHNHTLREERWEKEDEGFRAMLVVARIQEKERQNKIRADRVAQGLPPTPPPYGIPDILVIAPEEGPPEEEN